MTFILELLEHLRPGEDLGKVSFRALGWNIVEVFRDSEWVKLPSNVLLEGDVVRVRPGMKLPAATVGLCAPCEGLQLAPYEAVPAAASTELLEAQQKVLFQVKTSPANDLLDLILVARAQDKKRSQTFFMICLKTGALFFRVYIVSLLLLNIALCVVWAVYSDRKWHNILTNPAFLFLAMIPVLLPALVKFLTCWGNAVLWCKCEHFGGGTVEVPSTQQGEGRLPSILRAGDELELQSQDDSENKAERDFEDREMNSIVPKVTLSACVAKCRSFLIGGIQRDFNILDMINSTTFMCFIDKEGIISENSKNLDEIVMMGTDEKNKIIALDLEHRSPLAPGPGKFDSIEFQVPNWEQYEKLLKSLALATSLTANPLPQDRNDFLINLNEEHAHVEATGELFHLLDQEEVSIFEDCMCVLASKIGVTDTYFRNSKHRFTLWSTLTPSHTEDLHEVSYQFLRGNKKDGPQAETVEGKFNLSKQRQQLENRMKMPCIILTSVIDFKGESYQAFSQGSAKVILQNCSKYFNGERLVDIGEEDRQRLNTTLLQWSADNYYTIGFSYTPICDQGILEVIQKPDFMLSLDERTKDVLQGAQRGHIFLGMIAVVNHAKPEANHFCDDVFEAGIRFVIFNEGTYLETKTFGNDLGLDTDWNSCIHLYKEQLENLKGDLILPQSTAEVREFLNDKGDEVPLLISMFANANKNDMLEMVKIYQENGEIVMAVGSSLNVKNLEIYQEADISIGISPQACGFCSTCNGLRMAYGRCPSVWERVSEKIICLPCIFTLGPQNSLYSILQVVKEARRLMMNIQNALLFTTLMYVAWSFCGFAAMCLGLPPLLSPLQCGYIVLLVVPTLALSFLGTPSQEKLMKKLPIKEKHLILRNHFVLFRNLVLRVVLFGLLVLGLHVWNLSLMCDGVFFYEWVSEREVFAEFNAVIFLLGIYTTCLFTTSCINGFESWFKVKGVKNDAWVIVIIGNLVAGSVIAMLFLAVHNKFEEFFTLVRSGWFIYLVYVVASIVLFLILELLNWETRKNAKKLQTMLKHLFETRLGLFSPK